MSGFGFRVSGFGFRQKPRSSKAAAHLPSNRTGASTYTHYMPITYRLSHTDYRLSHTDYHIDYHRHIYSLHAHHISIITYLDNGHILIAYSAHIHILRTYNHHIIRLHWSRQGCVRQPIPPLRPCNRNASARLRKSGGLTCAGAVIVQSHGTKGVEPAPETLNPKP